MKKKPKNIPDSVLACVWFAHPKYLDWEENKEIVITNILNRGALEAVRWAFRFYGERVICNVVAHPKRGHWFPQSLNFWSQFFNLSIHAQVYQKAIAGVLPPRK